MTTKGFHQHIGIVFLKTANEVPILVWAAKNCFWDLKQTQIKTLAKELDVEPATPDLLGLLEVLIQTVLPEATGNKIIEI